ncbi:MAG: argininosuccinate lyase [Bdellovibrionota bacterium]
MSKRLWEKGEDLNRQVHAFTVGDDPVVDLELAYWDTVGSAAHVKMLKKIGLATAAECNTLLKELHKISELCKAGKLEIPFELEDCHTAIETQLIAAAGEAGRKVHTGRSRNDQVLLAVRLYLRDRVCTIVSEVLQTAELLFQRAEELGHQPMPGYTHFQPAMPASLRLWLHAFGESFLELAREGAATLDLLDSNPLGAASGFGTSLGLDRQATTDALEFARVQRNPIAVQNSRGQYELKALRLATDIAGVIEKLMIDLILYTTREFGFFNLPTSLTTGSSIMPQKHNPDVLELLRGRAAKIRGAETELSWVLAKLPSHYHRDFQYSKEPMVRGLRHLLECLPITREVIRSFTVNKERLDNAMTADLYATYDVYRQVKDGVAFRDAYRVTAAKYKAGDIKAENLKSDFDTIAAECDAELAQAKADLKTFSGALKQWTAKLNRVEKDVFTAV